MTDAGHRPWPLPHGPWVVAMRWHDLLFAHWPVPLDDLRAVVPRPLQIDTCEKQAWIGVIPFRMSGVRLRFTPPVPGLSSFPELNVRTYVTAGGKPGVYFFSLDAASRAAVSVARKWYRLPYFHARMSARRQGDAVSYASERVRSNAPPAEFRVCYRPSGDELLAGRASLARWLTERYCLYTVDSRKRLYRAEIHHAPWSLQPAEAEIETNTMTLPLGLPLPDTPPLLHFSRRMDVVAWRLTRAV